jgi:citrate lyase subunit beta/citryl-CoA lyase
MGCIHPRQIPVIRDGFKPTPEEIEKGKRIVIAYEEAQKMGLGVVALGTKMIDPPVVARAQRTIALALNLGIIDERWRDGSDDKNRKI